MDSTIVIALINFFGVLLLSWVNHRGNKETHDLVNSRISELLALAKKNWREGRDEEEKRDAEH